MQHYPKIRQPDGTYIVVVHKYGLHIGTLRDWMNGLFIEGKILAVSLTKGPLKKWLRSYLHHEAKKR
jgi:hypothetical protein